MTSHVAQRLNQRFIEKEEIEEVLIDPDYSYSGKQGEMNLVKELSKGRKIRVVVKPEKGRIKIIAAIIVD